MRRLIPRELQVAELIAEGRSNRQISRHLGITIATTRAYIHKIYEALDLVGNAQARVLLAVKALPEYKRQLAAGLLDPPKEEKHGPGWRRVHGRLAAD